LEEERIKSALEIAMEKVSGLPELTAEEIAEQREKEYGPIGEAIAKKFLGGTLADGEILAELSRYSQEPRRIVRRELVAGLCRELRLDNERETAGRALSGMKQLASEKRGLFEAVAKDFLNIFSEFIEKKEKKFREFELLARELIENLGISGSAVRINMNENETWKQELNRIRESYEPRLKKLRNVLTQGLQST
jgi:predicted component of type VI protein secretion system